MIFSEAIMCVLEGKKVTRSKWLYNNKYPMMYISDDSNKILLIDGTVFLLTAGDLEVTDWEIHIEVPKAIKEYRYAYEDRIFGELKFSEYMSELEALDFNEASIGTLMRLDYTMRIR